MLKFIAKLFAAETTRTAPNTTARLSLNTMEDRDAPAALANPMLVPRAEAPVKAATTRTIIAIQPADAATDRAIIAIQPGTTSGIIIEGG